MEEKQGYDVLRIVTHGGRCYMSADYVRGKPLIVWLKYHPQISRTQLYQWIRELIMDLEHFHQCRGNPCYQYVNPYSIIMSEDEKLYLLDLGSREQEEMIHLMQRRHVRENFLSPENQYYQKVSVREDIYGLGKTIQYLLSAVDVEPALKKMEEIRFQKIISRCLNQDSKKSYQTIQELSEHFPKEKKQKKKNNPLLKKILAGIAVIILAAIVVLQLVRENGAGQNKKEGTISGEISETENYDRKELEDYRLEMQQKQEQWDEEKCEIEEAAYEREQELVYELALVYFIELEDYHNSREILESMGEMDRFAEDFAVLCSYLDGQMEDAGDAEIERLLERMETEVPDAEDERYAYCISKGYQMLQGEEEAQTEDGEQGKEPQNEGGKQEEAQDTQETVVE